jgi:16S rRNA (guanine527-N7)-methyltransferase
VIDNDEVERTLHEALGTSQRLGFLGDRPIDEVIEHARAFVAALSDTTGAVIDLGAGGGVPGLVIALDRPDLQITLLDRRTKRTDFLSRTVRRLRLDDRVQVIAADTEDALRAGTGPFDGVVARGFGPPEITLRTARAFVATDGVIVISEPPVGDRWDPELPADVGVRRTTADRRVARFTPIPMP